MRNDKKYIRYSKSYRTFIFLLLVLTSIIGIIIVILEASAWYKFIGVVYVVVAIF